MNRESPETWLEKTQNEEMAAARGERDFTAPNNDGASRRRSRVEILVARHPRVFDASHLFRSDWRSGRGKYLEDLRGTRVSTSSARADPPLAPLAHEIDRCTRCDVIDTIRHSRRMHIADKDALFYENTLNARRSPGRYSRYLLCNTKCTPGIENLRSPSRRTVTSILPFSARATNIHGMWKPTFLDVFLSGPSTIQSIDGIPHD